MGVFMRDWFTGEAIYVPSWVLAGTIMGLWGVTKVSLVATVVWLLVGTVIAGLAWRASVGQARQGRLVVENLGKLVSVTTPSPVNIIAAAGAKILTLDHEISELKAELQRQSRRTLSPAQKEAITKSLQESKEYLAIGILLRADNAEADEYARQFSLIFSHLGMGGALYPYNLPEDLTGLVIRVEDPKAPPSRVLGVSAKP
jgi:hypothetical protein